MGLIPPGGQTSRIFFGVSAGAGCLHLDGPSTCCFRKYLSGIFFFLLMPCLRSARVGTRRFFQQADMDPGHFLSPPPGNAADAGRRTSRFSSSRAEERIPAIHEFSSSAYGFSH